jgi:hypothetical protein
LQSTLASEADKLSVLCRKKAFWIILQNRPISAWAAFFVDRSIFFGSAMKTMERPEDSRE